MFEFSNIYHFYFDLLFTVFSVFILIAALIALPVGIRVMKLVKSNLWGAGISFVLYLASLLYICYKKITLSGLLYATIAADVFLGAVMGFLIAVAVLKYRERSILAE